MGVTCPRRFLVFSKKPSFSSLPFRRSWNTDCFERRRMQSIFDTSWSSPLLPSQVSPWLMLPPDLIFDGDVANAVYKFYNIKDNKVVSFEGGDGSRSHHNDEFKGSSHGWLALFDSSTNDLFIYNPISRSRLKLPTMDTLPLRGTPRKGAIDFNLSEECIVKKVILSSSDPEKDESCVAMMLYGAENRLACCHPARGVRAKWYPLNSHHWVWDWDDDGHERTARSYQDIAYSAREKLFFCITKEDELEAWDSTALLTDDMPISIKDYFHKKSGHENHYPWPRRCEREFYLKSLCRHHERYLVVAEPYDVGNDNLPSQQLFLVLRHKIRLMDGVYWDDEGLEEHSYDCPMQTQAFDVHKFDVKKRELVYMDRTLDGLAFFVGKNHSFAVKASDFDGLNPNSIYFTDSEHEDVFNHQDEDDGGGHDNGIYNYEDATFSSCYYPCEAKSYKRIRPAPMWFSPLHHT